MKEIIDWTIKHKIDLTVNVFGENLKGSKLLNELKCEHHLAK